MKILTINNKKEEKILRTRVDDFDFRKSGKGKIKKIIKEMKKTMIEANGLGLSANQVGLDVRLFVALISSEPLKRDENNKIIASLPESMNFCVILNPKIIKFSKKKIAMEEGCLSIPGVYGLVERPERVTIDGQDENGKKIKIQAEGLAARVFQHETDHLNGILFTDKAKSTYGVDSK